MYYAWIWPGIESGPHSLVKAMEMVYGCGNAWIVRQDGTPVVSRAGNAYAFDYLPRPRTIERRKTARAHRRWEAEMQAHMARLDGRVTR